MGRKRKNNKHNKRKNNNHTNNTNANANADANANANANADADVNADANANSSSNTGRSNSRPTTTVIRENVPSTSDNDSDKPIDTQLQEAIFDGPINDTDFHDQMKLKLEPLFTQLNCTMDTIVKIKFADNINLFKILVKYYLISLVGNFGKSILITKLVAKNIEKTFYNPPDENESQSNDNDNDNEKEEAARVAQLIKDSHDVRRTKLGTYHCTALAYFIHKLAKIRENEPVFAKNKNLISILISVLHLHRSEYCTIGRKQPSTVYLDKMREFSMKTLIIISQNLIITDLYRCEQSEFVEILLHFTLCPNKGPIMKNIDFHSLEIFSNLTDNEENVRFIVDLPYTGHVKQFIKQMLIYFNSMNIKLDKYIPFNILVNLSEYFPFIKMILLLDPDIIPRLAKIINEELFAVIKTIEEHEHEEDYMIFIRLDYFVKPGNIFLELASKRKNKYLFHKFSSMFKMVRDFTVLGDEIRILYTKIVQAYETYG